MNDTPTPRTNKAFLDGYTFCKEDMMPAVAFASQLERELAAARQEIKDLHKAYGFELRDPNGTIWEYAAKMKEEIIAARAELKAVTEQRDGLRSGIDYASDQLHTVTEQRDRLAEAVNAATILIAAKGRHNTMLAYNGLREALQSLTPKDHE